MGSYEWDEHAAVRDDGLNGRLQRGRLFSPFSDFGDPLGIAGLDFNRFASIDMHSTLNGAELNLDGVAGISAARSDTTTPPPHSWSASAISISMNKCGI